MEPQKPQASQTLPYIFGGHRFIMTHTGLLLWPRHRLAFVSDLHLEKGSFLARSGQFLPPYDSQDTLDRLRKDLTPYPDYRLILLGDTLHDPQGYDRLSSAAKNLLTMIADAHTPLWILGNHEKGYVPDGFDKMIDFYCDGLVFRHEAIRGNTAARADNGEISGHFHPKAKLDVLGQSFNRPCFIGDQSRLILPAYGSYTGGLDVRNPAVKTLFPGTVSLCLLGKRRIIRLDNQLL